MTDIIVFGSNGQLGNRIEHYLQKSNLNCVFFTKKECDISDKKKLEKIYKKYKPAFVVNAAAYTDVDGAEKNFEQALSINFEAVSNLVNISNKFESVLIHFSTDYVFNSKNKIPIKENSEKNPINKYGVSKHLGEEIIINQAKKYFIFRISWVYSQNGKNFPNTIIDLALKEKTLHVVDDQLGVPTSVDFISKMLLKILLDDKSNKKYGIYNLIPSGHTTWYELAIKIVKKIKKNDNENNYKVNNIIPVKSNFFETTAKRPNYSVLDNTKLIKTFKINTYSWELYFDDFLDKLTANE